MHFSEHPRDERIKLLGKDILFGPYHYFGDHQKCNTYFCEGPKKDEINLVATECQGASATESAKRFWDHLSGIASRVQSHASSLIYCENNNYVEIFNNLLAMAFNGKRINHNQRGGIVTRTMAAAVNFNTSGRYMEAINKAAHGPDAELGERPAPPPFQ